MNKIWLTAVALFILSLISCDPIPVDVVGDEDDGTITGTVTRWGVNSPYVDDEYMDDPNDLPIVAATDMVVALDASSFYDLDDAETTTTTNATGQYVLTHVPIGLHTVFVCEADDFLTDNTRSGLAYSVLVTKDAVTTADVFVYKECSYLFRGDVSMDSVPMPNQTVNVTLRCRDMFGGELDPEYRTIQTDVNGHFSRIIYTWGVYRVTFDVPDSDDSWGGQKTIEEPFSSRDTEGGYHIIDFELHMYPN